MARFDITVSEFTTPYTLPWIVTIDNGEKILDIHLKTKDKALKLAEKYQARGWVKTPGAHRFLQCGFRETLK